MTYPFVSVIIPNYNHAPYLKQRIDSILSQTYQHFEIIILDDCSTDNSKEVLEAYRSNPKIVQIIFNETNGGSAFKQWQKGIELAKGEWLWLAESDDWCEPQLLETLLQGINSDCAIAVAQSVVVKDSGEILWKSDAFHFAKTYTGVDFIKSRMLLDNFGIPNASMCIFNKNFYSKIDSQYTSYKFCGDWVFWVSLAMQGNVFVSGKYLNYFRKHDKDVSGGAFYKGLHYSEYFTLLTEFEKRQIISPDEKRALLKDKLKMFLNDVRVNKGTRKKLAEQFKRLLKAAYFKTVLRFKTVRLFKQLSGGTAQ